MGFIPAQAIQIKEEILKKVVTNFGYFDTLSLLVTTFVTIFALLEEKV